MRTAREAASASALLPTCAAGCALLLAACLTPRAAVAPLPALQLSTPVAGARTLIVFLPGIRDVPADFARHGWSAIAAESGIAADSVAVDAHFGYFASQTLVPRLREDVIAPARARGREVWLGGISLGGLGALIYAREHPEEVAGVVAFAPFLGGDAILDEIDAAGGLAHWQPGPPRIDPATGKDEFQRELWRFLKLYSDPSARPVPLWLAFGTSDKLARGQRILAAVLPADHVVTSAGAHDWRTWTDLWRRAATRLPIN